MFGSDFFDANLTSVNVYNIIFSNTNFVNIL